MVTVLLCGSEKDAEITNILLAAIRSADASALHITAKTVSMLPPDAQNADFLVIDNANIQGAHMEKGVIVFKQEIKGCLELDLPAGFIAVTESDNDTAIKILQKNALQTVTCGLSQRDTLTYSSLDSEKAVISLQREIKSLHGESMLPHEIPVALQSTRSDYPLLAAVAVLLLSGIKVPERGLTL